MGAGGRDPGPITPPALEARVRGSQEASQGHSGPGAPSVKQCNGRSLLPVPQLEDKPTPTTPGRNRGAPTTCPDPVRPLPGLHAACVALWAFLGPEWPLPDGICVPTPARHLAPSSFAIPDTGAFVWDWTWVRDCHCLCGQLSIGPCHLRPAATPALSVVTFWASLVAGKSKSGDDSEV